MCLQRDGSFPRLFMGQIPCDWAHCGFPQRSRGEGRHRDLVDKLHSESPAFLSFLHLRTVVGWHPLDKPQGWLTQRRRVPFEEVLGQT